jgi:hypothetical protein
MNCSVKFLSPIVTWGRPVPGSGVELVELVVLVVLVLVALPADFVALDVDAEAVRALAFGPDVPHADSPAPSSSAAAGTSILVDLRERGRIFAARIYNPAARRASA